MAPHNICTQTSQTLHDVSLSREGSILQVLEGCISLYLLNFFFPDIQAEMTHLLYKNLPDTFLAFMQAGRKLHTRVRVDDDDHRGTLLILASLLDLNHALFKWGPIDQHWYRFTQKSLSPLMDLLVQYCSDVVILKKILDIFILSMDQSAAGTTHSSQSQPSRSQFAGAVDENSLFIATAFVDMVVKGNICDSLHYRSGPVGFGGGIFQSSDGDDATGGIESGDRPLLRKLCRATLSAIRVLQTFDNSKRRLNESGMSFSGVDPGWIIWNLGKNVQSTQSTLPRNLKKTFVPTQHNILKHSKVGW